MSDDTTNTSAEVTADNSESADASESPVNSPVLTAEQEINALRSAHQFFSNFDRVPGFLANQWSQALDTVAVVANSLISKKVGSSTVADTSETTLESTDTTVSQ